MPSLSNGGFADCTERAIVDVGTQCAVSCNHDYRSSVTSITCSCTASWNQQSQCIGIS